MEFSVFLAVIGASVAVLLGINSFSGYSLAQILTNSPQALQLGPVKDIFKVSIMLFGVDDKTGNALSFVKVNNITTGRFFNATRDDLIDRDGVVETVISFPNETVAQGTNFTACNVILNDMSMSCKWGLNMPKRTEAVQIILPTYKPKAN